MVDMEARERAALQGLADLNAYYDDHIGVPLSALVNQTAKEEALIAIVHCARSLVISLCKMDEPREFRGRVVVARSIWEHYLQFELLRRSDLKDAGERCLAFAEVERWNRYVRIQENRQRLGAPAIDFVDKYLEDPKRRERVGELLKKYGVGA